MRHDAHQRGSDGQRSLTSPRVLLVEDDPDVRQMLRAYLEVCSFTTDEAVDGADALKKFNTELHRTVVLDLMMPAIDGHGVIRELATRDPLLLQRIIVISGGGNHATSDVDPRVYDVLEKPFPPRQLVQVVRACLQQAHVVEE